MEAGNWKHINKTKQTKNKKSNNYNNKIFVNKRFVTLRVIIPTCGVVFDQSERMHLYSYQTHCTPTAVSVMTRKHHVSNKV